MLSDIIRGRIARRITAKNLVVVIRVLVNTDVIDPHSSREELLQLLKVDGSERVGHAQVGNNCHRFLGNLALANVSVWSDGIRVQTPGGRVANIPGNKAIVTVRVFEGVFLIRFAVIPVIVEIRET